MIGRRLLAALLATIAGAGLAACGDGGDAAPRAVEPLDADFLPASLLGLEVDQEDLVDDVTSRTNAYVEALGLYSLRDDDLLQATLQIGRFADDADHGTSTFRRAIVNNVGSTEPRPFRMGDQTVWLTTGRSQRVSVWFEDDLFFLLAVRDDFDKSRGLLRATVELAK